MISYQFIDGPLDGAIFECNPFPDGFRFRDPIPSPPATVVNLDSGFDFPACACAVYVVDNSNSTMKFSHYSSL